ncbi:ABC transporter substrate-binding protein [Cohnella boryungensis]|uniref:ABC transporter substrate-binding protein n=1 Tax=Cohnella boryungensis TaxID=768479 RepID=A0ABV8SBJ2_9BACL
MKGSKKPIYLILIAILLMGVLAACSSNNEKNAGSTGSGAASSTPSAGASGEASGDVNEAIKDPYELTIALPVFGAVPKDLKDVQAEINKITQAKINTTVTILPISIGTWTQQMNLMMSSGEKLDLAFTFGQMYSSSVASGQIVELDELLKEYGQGAVEAVGADNLKAALLNGKTYGVPVTGAFATQSAIFMRKDLVDKYKIDVNSIKKFQDLEPVFQTIKDNEAGVVPLVSGLTTPLEYHRMYDKLGDRYGVLPGYDNELKLVNLFETQEYADQVSLMHKWFKAGYINKDSATTQTTVEEMVKAGKGFSYFMANKPDMLAGEIRLVGKEMIMIPLSEAYSTTSDMLVGLYTIAQQSKNPERAMMMLNLMYSDSAITNLLAWGVEGKHYVKVSETQIDYPQGVNSETVGYKISGYLTGNQMNTYVFKNDEPDLWEKTRAFNDSAIKSKAFGFAFDSAPVKNEETAVKNVIEQYRKIIETGTIDPADKLAEFNEKLKSAGIEKIIAEKQKQLDAWAAAKQ